MVQASIKPRIIKRGKEIERKKKSMLIYIKRKRLGEGIGEIKSNTG